MNIYIYMYIEATWKTEVLIQVVKLCGVRGPPTASKPSAAATQQAQSCAGPEGPGIQTSYSLNS